MAASITHLKESPATESNQREIYFCPNGNIALTIGRRDFNETKINEIRLLHKLDRRWNLVIPLYFALWLVPAVVAVATEIPVVDLICYFAGGVAISTLSVLVHESTHNLFTHNPKIDRWIGFLCGLPMLLTATGYRIRHLIHHKKVRSPEDPDDIENLTAHSQLLRMLFVVMFFIGAYLYLIDVPIKAFRRATSKQRAILLLECGAMLATVIAAWMILPAHFMIQGWLVPLLVSAQIANIRGIAEHGLTAKGNEMIDTRTVVTHPALSFLMCSINYHLEHHLYPGVPWYNLPKLHRLLQEDYRKAGSSIYTSYSSFLLDVFKALKSGVVPGAGLIPKYLREEVCL